MNRYSVALDGSSGYVTLGSKVEVLGGASAALTVSVWTKLVNATPDSGDGIFSIGGDGGFGTGFDLFWSTELANPSVAFYAPGSTAGIRAIPQSPTEWFHVVAVFDPVAANGGAQLYFDGALVGQQDVPGGSLEAAGEVWIGKYFNDDFLTAGWFDEVAIWNVALQADEIAAAYNGGTPTDLTQPTAEYDAHAALIGYWRMGDDDGGAGTNVSDLAGNSPATLSPGAMFSTDIP
jgi:hypothetical protein